jgi:hypothetical protein
VVEAEFKVTRDAEERYCLQRGADLLNTESVFQRLLSETSFRATAQVQESFSHSAED